MNAAVVPLRDWLLHALATIWRDLPGFTRTGSLSGLTRGQRTQSEKLEMKWAWPDR